MNYIEKLIQEKCPNGVKYKKLNEIGDFYGGLTGKSKDDFKNGNCKFISYMNIYKNPALDIDNIEETVCVSENEKQNKAEYGDILFTGSSETPDECAISSVITKYPTENLYLNSFCFGYRLKDISIFLPDFLKHLLRDSFFRKQVPMAVNGVTRFNVSKTELGKIEIPVPPIEIQREIVKVLDNFSELTAELTAELSARKQQYEYYRNQLLDFGTPEKAKNCEWKPLNDCIISLNTGLNPRKFFRLNTNDAEGYYVTIRELKNNRIVFNDKTDRINEEARILCNNRSNLEVGDVLFSGTGTIGETALIEEKPLNWNVKEGIYSIKPQKDIILPKFLLYILHSKEVEFSYMEKRCGGTVQSVPMRDLRNIYIPIPSLEKQREIVNKLDQFDKLVNDLTEGLPAEIEARQKQYEYYRNKLLTFKRLETN